MESKHSRNDYLYCADHTAKLVQEQWVDTVNHDREWTEKEEGDNSNEVLVVSFYPRTEPVEPLEWKALENRLKPSSVEPPKLELNELPKHLEYAFLQENNQLPMVISSALSTGLTHPSVLTKSSWKTSSNQVSNLKDESNLQTSRRLFKERRNDRSRGFLSNSASKSVKMLNWYEKTNLVFNWEKCLFMARMDSSLALRSSGFIEVAEKIITNPPALNPAAYDLGQRIDKHFKPIHYASKTMNEAQENYTTYKRVPSFVCAFEQILSILGLIQYYHFSRISRAAEFNIEIRDKKGTENLADDHLSRLENPDLGKLTKAEIRDLFPEEQVIWPF
ncbi:hypothetical protein Tco_0831179 [Tanacetum coccineum]